ncbi:DUF1330 domain-containing protein [Seonamhaeicola sp. MEBiC1930]|uniref:DUF1330 domain-containing protein n=1 Tax=Seonamhaeicola sp. MEBiC01930 TaxID=2976768 RepID=UPI003245CD88
MSKLTYLNATEETGKAFYLSEIEGTIVMLNLLKFRKWADYSNFKDIDPGKQTSGEEAYQLYIKNTLPFLKDSGSEVLFQGNAGGFLIGPENQNWDLVLLVKHKSKADFLKFASNKDYLRISGHRTAAIEDSRLLPITETS